MISRDYFWIFFLILFLVAMGSGGLVEDWWNGVRMGLMGLIGMIGFMGLSAMELGACDVIKGW